jgi:hypothetical protein
MPKMDKKPKKERKSRAQQRVLLKLPEDFSLEGANLFIQSGEDRLVVPWEVRVVTVQMTPEERRAQRRRSRQEYMRKPDVIAKNKARMANPEVIAKKKQYASREDIKQRKKLHSAKARKLKHLLREMNPELYQALDKEVLEKLKQSEKWARELDHLEFLEQRRELEEAAACEENGFNS